MKYSIRITARSVEASYDSFYPYYFSCFVQLREGRRPLTPAFLRKGSMEEQLVELAESVGLSPSPFLDAWAGTKHERLTYHPWWASYWGSSFEKKPRSHTIPVLP